MLAGFSFDQIQAAHQRIAPHIHRTPLLQNQWINRHLGRQVYFKCEHFQKGGAFKIRGAINSMLQLDPQQLSCGVVTHSSGNHAQALAIAAKMLRTSLKCELRCTVIMPENSPKIKILATQENGADVIFCQPNQAARIAATHEVIQRTGATLVHPFDQPNIILGQATAAKEILEQQPDLGTVVVPVGGGGLLAGTCLVAKAWPDRAAVQVLAAEPSGADDAFRSFSSGQRVTEHTPNTIADGLLTTLGDLTWPIIRQHVDAIVTVTDAQIQDAMQLLWERLKWVVEPSGAVPLAGLIQAIEQQTLPLPADQPIGVLLSGGNRSFAGI